MNLLGRVRVCNTGPLCKCIRLSELYYNMVVQERLIRSDYMSYIFCTRWSFASVSQPSYQLFLMIPSYYWNPLSSYALDCNAAELQGGIPKIFDKIDDIRRYDVDWLYRLPCLINITGFFVTYIFRWYVACTLYLSLIQHAAKFIRKNNMQQFHLIV